MVSKASLTLAPKILPSTNKWWRQGLIRDTHCGISTAADTLDTDTDNNLLAQDMEQLIRRYSKLPQTSTSLQMLMKTGSGEMLGKAYNSEAFRGRMGQQLATQRVLNQMASFLRQEIPIRLAHRILDLDQVPYLRDMASVQAVKQIYMDSFSELLEFQPIRTTEDENNFALMLERLYLKHSSVLVQMAKGAYELREIIGRDHIKKRGCEEDPEWKLMTECQYLLDRFYMSRIGIRVLAGQYLALRDDFGDDYVGMICKNTSPYDIVRQAAENAKKMCRRQYGRAPQIEISGRLDLTFAYVPSYLHYISLELLKVSQKQMSDQDLSKMESKNWNILHFTQNAVRATSETHSQSVHLPVVNVIIADGMTNEDVVIKIADEGGGIRRSQVEKIWSYLFTTADPSVQRCLIAEGGDHSNANPIAGLGYGLPISRSYCQYFGGDLDLVSMEGYGTDAFIHLKKLGDSEEPLPV